jgi:hypothetical protein
MARPVRCSIVDMPDGRFAVVAAPASGKVFRRAGLLTRAQAEECVDLLRALMAACGAAVVEVPPFRPWAPRAPPRPGLTDPLPRRHPASLAGISDSWFRLPAIGKRHPALRSSSPQGALRRGTAGIHKRAMRDSYLHAGHADPFGHWHDTAPLASERPFRGPCHGEPGREPAKAPLREFAREHIRRELQRRHVGDLKRRSWLLSATGAARADAKRGPSEICALSARPRPTQPDRPMTSCAASRAAPTVPTRKPGSTGLASLPAREGAGPAFRDPSLVRGAVGCAAAAVLRSRGRGIRRPVLAEGCMAEPTPGRTGARARRRRLLSGSPRRRRHGNLVPRR